MHKTLILNFEEIECCNCGTIFAVSESFKNKLKETHKSFYCPNGHPQSYIGKSEAEKLKDELTRIKCQKDQLDQELFDKEKKIRSIEKRIANGVCPCCNRTFTNLQRHMNSKHPEIIK